MISRTNMKLQVMREHTRQLEKQEAEQMLASSMPTQSSAIQVPRVTPMEVSVPPQVFKVQTALENPTRFHMRENQKRQVRQFLSIAHSASPTALSPHNVETTSALPRLTRSIGDAICSPTSPISVAHSSTATSPPSELDEFWDDFQALETGMDSDVNLLVSTINLPNTVPGTISAANTTLQDLFPQSNHRQKVSASCPAEISEISELSPSACGQDDSFCEADIRAIVKDRQKKDNHNMIERRRRFNINDRIKELGTLLPKTNDAFYDLIRDQRQNKGTILKASVDYLRVLKKEISKIPTMEDRQKRLEQQNKSLLLRIQHWSEQIFFSSYSI